MTGRDLVLYIMSHHLEDEPIFKDGKFIGFINIPEAAEKFNVGVNTIYAWIANRQIDFVDIGHTYLIPAECEIKKV